MPRIRHTVRDDVRVLIVDQDRLVDDLTLQEVHHELVTLLEESDEKRFVLDLARVGFVSSAALGMLVRIRKKCGEQGIGLKICCVGPAVDETFRITGLHALFDIQPSVSQAVSSFAQDGSGDPAG